MLRSADVVHVHLMRDLVTLPVALLASALGRPLVLQTHGMIDPTEKRVARAVDVLGLRRVLRKADAVLHLTGQERELTEAVVAPEPMGPAYRLVNGVTPQPARDSGRAPGRPPTVLYCARVQEGKRPQDFVGAMPTVLAKYPGARFVLAGPDTGALAGEMLARARSLGVGHALEYVGALDHAGVLARLRESEVYVLPSIKDAFSVSVLEALSVGLPSSSSPAPAGWRPTWPRRAPGGWWTARRTTRGTGPGSAAPCWNCWTRRPVPPRPGPPGSWRARASPSMRWSRPCGRCTGRCGTGPGPPPARCRRRADRARLPGTARPCGIAPPCGGRLAGLEADLPAVEAHRQRVVQSPARPSRNPRFQP